jgi:hypothetical protein
MSISAQGFRFQNRVMANNVYMRTVVSNGITVFNLTSWVFVGATFGAVAVSFSGTLTVNTNFTSFGFTLCNQAANTAGTQLATVMNNLFPIQNYGGGAFGQITFWEVTNAYGFVERCVIDYGFPPLRYQVQGQY